MYKVRWNDDLKHLCMDPNVDLADLDVSDVRSFCGVFESSNRKDFSGIEKWNVKGREDFSHCFHGAKHFNADLKKWDMSCAKNMSSMFESCIEFEGNGIALWDVRSVTDFSYCFNGCIKLKCDLSFWDPCKAQNVHMMLWNCNSLNVDLSSWKLNLDQSKKFDFSNSVKLDLLPAELIMHSIDPQVWENEHS